MPSTYSQTADRALNILWCFSLERPIWALQELAEHLGLHKSVVYRLVSTLRRHGLVAYDADTKTYSLGFGVLSLASALDRSILLKRVARPVMKRVTLATGETTFLTVVGDDDTSVCLDVVDANRGLRFTMHPGSRIPLHAGASARILLAHLSKVDIQRNLARTLTQFTPSTLADVEALDEELTTIRKRGYATSLAELDEGVCAFAVPVWDHNGKNLLAGFTIAGPLGRVNPSKSEHFVGIIKDAADEISHGLGFAK